MDLLHAKSVAIKEDKELRNVMTEIMLIQMVVILLVLLKLDGIVLINLQITILVTQYVEMGSCLEQKLVTMETKMMELDVILLVQGTLLIGIAQEDPNQQLQLVIQFVAMEEL